MTEENDDCLICGGIIPHIHTDVQWNDLWGMVPGPDDEIIYQKEYE